MLKTNKHLLNLIISKLCWIGVLLIACYILFGTSLTHYLHENVISTYVQEMKNIDSEDKKDALEDAVEYNQALFHASQLATSEVTEQLFSDEYYNSFLNLSRTGVMARIKIPKISVDLPIYHGTNEDALSNGVGHLQGSSFPVGGINTRAVLSAHRGVPTAKLFTRLDELVEDDLIFIETLDETLVYSVKKIEVIHPEDMEALNIIPDKDLISLVTCTPYAINTHRLVVTCERIENPAQQAQDIQKAIPSWREIIISYIWPIILILIMIGSIFKFVKRRNLRKAKRKDDFREKNLPKKGY